MISIYIFIPVIIVLLIVNVFVYKYARKKGENDFAELIFAAGFMGKHDAFKNYNRYATPGGIVFVGDSITQDFNVYEYFPDKQVYNRGIGGDTSAGVLKRMEVSVYDLKPSKVFLQIGTNDLELLDDGVDMIVSRIKQIIEEIHQFDDAIEIYLISVYPVNPNIDASTVGKRSNDNIKAINKQLQTMKDVTYINLYDSLEKDGVLNPEYTLEGLHLNQQGYEVLKDAMTPYL